MRILITGGAGFIGSHLQDKLINLGHQVVVVDNLSTGKKNNLHAKTKFYTLNVQDKKLAAIFKKEKPDIVYHLAAQMNLRKSIADPIFDADNNILGGLNLFDNCVKYKVKKVIFFSTGGAMYSDQVKTPTPESLPPEPMSPYGIAKLALEKYLKFYHNVYGLPYAIIRPSNVYGPRQNYLGEAGVVAIFCHQILTGSPLTINGHGRQTRDYVYVKDVVRAAIKVMPRNISGIYHIATGREISVNDLAQKLINESGRKIAVKHCPAIKGEQLKSCLSHGKATRELGWTAEYKLPRGLRETFKWFKENF